MINLRRNKKSFYLCKKNAETLFEAPINKVLHYEPVSSVGERISIGTDYAEYLKIKCTVEEAKDFKNGDMLYVYVTPPETPDPLCKNADYYVSGDPRIMINEAEIMLKKASGADGKNR